MKLLKDIAYYIHVAQVVLATCGFNLLVIVTIIALLTLMDQGAPLLVALLTSPGNLILFWLIIFGTALAYGHYPVYSYKWKMDYNIFKKPQHRSHTKWKLNSPQVCGIGIITFQDSEETSPHQKNGDDNQIKITNAFHSFRGLLGLAILLAIFYCLIFTYQKFIGSDDHPMWFSGVLIILIGLYFVLQLRDTWIEPALKGTFGLFVITIVVNLYLSTAGKVWTPGIFWTFSLALTTLSLFYIAFKKYRSRLNKRNFLFSDDVSYVRLIASLGWISLLTIVTSQFYPTTFNPIIIILAFFNVIYGMYVIILKHRLYYFYKELTGRDSQSQVTYPVTSIFFRFIVPILLIGVVSWTIIAGIRGNNLHKLNLVPDPSAVSIDQFRSNFEDQVSADDSTNRNTLYFIASYGGGLKANTWNLMVMDTLDKLGILESTIAISGVSGGNLGQFLYGAIGKSSHSDQDKRSKIQGISSNNYLSRDLAWLLGWDFVRELDMLSSSFRPDRAIKSLRIYEEEVGDIHMTGQGMQTYWKSIYDHKGHYPVLISNAAGVNNRRGICCSVSFPEKGTTFEKTFPGAVNLLKYRDSPGASLSYLGAASTSNRFPFLSPAAKIPSKGHYVDGGYFDNSGMFSLLNFYNALMQDTSWADIFRDRTIVFIQIANHKSTYIRQMVPDSLIQIDKIAEGGEIFQVLKTKASTEFLPYYFEQKVKLNDSLHFVRINIPYKFTLEDIKNQFHALKLDPDNENKIRKIIENNDHYIDSLYTRAAYSQWESIEPATARFLSQPAINYMRMVMKHDGRVVEWKSGY